MCSPALLAARGRPRGPAALRDWPLLYDLGWDADWSYWFARQGQPTPDLSRASGFRLYSMLIQAAASGLGAAIGRPMLIAHELERRILVPLFERQQEAPERCCLITTAASRQRPELRAFRAWILHEAAASPSKSTICTSAAFAPITAFRWLATECSQILSAWSASISQPQWTEPPCRQSVRSGWRWCRKGNGRILECDSEGGE